MNTLKLKYILDANVFITPARTYYSFDFGTKFWDFLLEKASSGIICSIDKVYDEIKEGDKNDPLRKWAEQDFEQYFYPTKNNDVIKHYADIVKYVENNKANYKEEAIKEFLEEKNTDAWVIAFAKYKNLVVVTEEKSNPNSKRKIYIPDVCNHCKVKFIHTLDMLKVLNFRL